MEIEIWMKLAFIVTCLAKFDFRMKLIEFNILLTVLLTSCLSWGQNLVPNPSFEDTVFCPIGDVSNAVGWSNYSDQSPDYFHSCSSVSDFSVPNNWGGYQQPASSGNAYCALSAYYPVNPNKREIIGRNLSESMVIGTKYYFSMKVSLSIENYISSSYACNKLGVRFSTIPYSNSNPAPINNSAHVWTDSIITDTTNWAFIFGSFTADSAYSYIALGNFFDDFNTDTIKVVSGTPTFVFAYYYIDDVCVSTDSAFAYNYSFITGNKESNLTNQVSVYPNPVVDYLIIQNIANQPIDITVYNILGEVIYMEQNVTGKTLSVNLTDSQKGLLIVNIKTESQSINYKLLKI